MRKLMMAAVLIGSLGIATASHAQDTVRKGKFYTYGIGRETCAFWTRDREGTEAEKAVAAGYVMGFVTRYELETNARHPSLDFQLKTVPELLAHLDDYCKTRRDVPMMAALHELEIWLIDSNSGVPN